jgi:hypothetical protein
VDERKVLLVQGSKSSATVVRKWDTSSSYELIRADFQIFFMLLREENKQNHIGSYWPTASSGLLSHSSCGLLIAHVTPLRNSRSNPEKALCKRRFHSIVTRYFLGRSLASETPCIPVRQTFRLMGAG